MIKQIKNKLYFFVAHYFKFFAQIRLAKWQPKVVVVTGSNGKTTLLHLIESQLGERARYSHHANSSFGIPFDILGLKRKNFTFDEWPMLFFWAPIKAFKKVFVEKIYVVEADCDRPGEGRFLADLLHPSVTIWLNLSKTHSMNFEKIALGRSQIKEVIANEFGNFLSQTKDVAIVNGDDELIVKQTERSRAEISKIFELQLENYQLYNKSTQFKIGGFEYNFSSLLPREIFYSILATHQLLKFLNFPEDEKYRNFQLPPGRSSIFSGIKDTTLIDSSYNANLNSMEAVLKMYNDYPAKTKWAVLGDMLEQGAQEQEEHEKLAQLILQIKLDKIILMGPRVCKYTYPKLQNPSAEKFERPKEALGYLLANISGGEVILFKGARFLEGVVEHLLANKSDVEKLCRREKIWQIRRKEWGL